MPKTQLEVVRELRDEAKRDLERVKRRDLHRWPNESWLHYHRRKRLLRKKRANRRKIYEGLDARVERAADRRQERREAKKGDRNPYDAHGGDVVSFDGHQVVEWIAHDLFAMRQHGWNGVVVSGYRTPEYSESLCYSMCGAPTCPGRCAGRGSKHAERGDGGGAVDVTDYVNAERVAFAIGSRLHNDLPADLVHLSATGH